MSSRKADPSAVPVVVMNCKLAVPWLSKNASCLIQFGFTWSTACSDEITAAFTFTVSILVAYWDLLLSHHVSLYRIPGCKDTSVVILAEFISCKFTNLFPDFGWGFPMAA